MYRCDYMLLGFCQESLLLSLLNRGTHRKHRLLCILTPSVFCIVCECVCVSGVSESREGRELSLSFFHAFSQPLSFVSSQCVYVCVGRCVGVFMAQFLLSTPLHLPPSLLSSRSPSFLLNLSFHPVQTVCRCCPPLPLHHACRNEIKP